MASNELDDINPVEACFACIEVKANVAYQASRLYEQQYKLLTLQQ